MPRFGALAALGVLAALPGLAVEALRVHVHRALPHDAEAFTQGLLWHAGKLYESTGLRGRSQLRRIDPATGAVERRQAISVMHFGEGLARRDDQLVMLTWHAEQALVFGVKDFDRRPPMRYGGEGWGLCHDGARFVMGDGSARLTFRHSDTFAVLGSTAVTLDGRPLPLLNELECVGDAVYANVFQQDYIVRIDAATGAVTGRIDASGLLPPDQASAADVLNGIAHDPETGRFYITGKLWPLMFEATFAP